MSKRDSVAADDDQVGIEIDRSDFLDRMRYVCPNGHTSWELTNSHIWCKSCSRQARNGADVEAEHWEILDKREDGLVPWRLVQLEE